MTESRRCISKSVARHTNPRTHNVAPPQSVPGRSVVRERTCSYVFRRPGVTTPPPLRPPIKSYLLLLFSLSVYVALTYIPGGGLLTGFAMRSDPNVAFG